MRDPVLPTIDGRLDTWCSFCANRDLPPERAYCAECRPAYQRYQSALNRSPARKLVRALFGVRPEANARLAPTIPRPHLK